MNDLIYYLMTTLKNGRQAWYVVQLNSKIKLELLEGYIRKNMGYDVRDLGEILYAGYEAKAPQEILDAVNTQYGTEFTN